MPTYRVVQGSFRRADGTRAEPGDTIEISEHRASRLPSDAYERVSTADTDSPPSTEATETDITPESVLPYDDYRLLSKMAALEDSDEVHGAMTSDDIVSYFEAQTGPHVAEMVATAESAMGESE